MNDEANKRFSTVENTVYLSMAIILVVIIAINRAINSFHNIIWIVDIASILSVCYCILNAKHNVLGLVYNLIASVILTVTNILQHVWLNAFICAFISIPFLTYGIIRWKKLENVDPSKTLNKLTAKSAAIIFSIAIVVCVGLAFLLRAIGEEYYIFDAVYSTGSTLGLILASKTYIDQYKAFVVGNIGGTGMYIMLALNNPNNISMVFTLIVFQTVNIMGWIHWHRLRKQMLTKENA